MGKRANPMAVKAALSYDIEEAAAALGKSTATIRNWIRDGLPVMASQKPYLISGAAIREYLTAKNRDAKQPLQDGELYCLSCRAGRQPEARRVAIVDRTAKTAMLKGICSHCGAQANRMVSKSKLGAFAEFFHFKTGGCSAPYVMPPRATQIDISKGPHSHAKN